MKMWKKKSKDYFDTFLNMSKQELCKEFEAMRDNLREWDEDVFISDECSSPWGKSEFLLMEMARRYYLSKKDKE